MSAKHRRSRPRNPNPRPRQAIAPGRPARGRKRVILWAIIAACAGVIVYAATGPLRARKEGTPGAATPRVPGPAIQFASTTYDFGKATGDDLVDCLFVFTNTGTAPLEISSVTPSCGCMKAGEWTRKVEPGRTGKIPVRYDSHHYSGYFAKSVTVTCNDSNQPSLSVEIKGTVWRPLQLIPESAVLTLSTETPSNSTSVRIISHLDDPLTVSGLTSDNSSLRVELQTNSPGKEYQINIQTTPPWPTSSQQGHITLKTSATNAPVVNIPAFINVQPVVVILPYVVRLPAPPLTNTLSTTVTIQNSGTNPVVVSEPLVTAAGVGTQLEVKEPGRLTAVTLHFPAGFEMAAGSNVEFRVKTDHPLYPVLKIPILQLTRPRPAITPGP